MSTHNVWFVFDPDPIDSDGPKLYGPFSTEEIAYQYANILHPEDGNGNAVILPLERINDE